MDGSGPLVPHWELEPKAGIIAPGQFSVLSKVKFSSVDASMYIYACERYFMYHVYVFIPRISS